MRLFAPAVAVVLLLPFPMMAQTDRTIVDLVLPTDNDALFSGDGPAFYQYVERNYKGVESTPWEGGQYGFVRDPTETSAGIVYTRFHEGIDIKPVHRDANGEPLDQVRAIADGKIVHTNSVPGHSNYGCYIVIEHRWGGVELLQFIRALEHDYGEARASGPKRRADCGNGLHRQRNQS
jgi:hypothetical protein